MSKVVVTRPILEEGLAPLRAEHQVEVLDVPRLTEESLIEVAAGAEALLTMLSDPITERVFQGCPDLKIVAQYAVGYDNIDLEAARRHGVAVTNTPGVLTEATADMAFALLLAVARRIIEGDRYVREGQFKRWETSLLLGPDFHGKTIGIVGMGRIGQAMARRARAFGMNVIYHNRRPLDASVEAEFQAQYVTIGELISESDVISLHTPLNSESRHLIDAAAFARMKPGAILINTARGPVVDEAALADALLAGRIGGAGLDVYEREPEVHPRLFETPNTVLAPHLGSATVETRTRMGLMCSEAILAALDDSATIPHRVA